MVKELGRIPPQAIDIEEALIGSLMTYPETVDNIIDLISSEDFYKDAHVKIFESIRLLHSDKLNVDFLSVSEKLNKLNQLESIGGDMYLTGLTMQSTITSLEQYALILKEKSVRRASIRIAHEIINLGFDNGSELEEVQNKSKELLEVTENMSVDNMIHIKDVSEQHLTDYMNRKDGKGKLPIRTHHKGLNECMPFGGFVGGDLVLIGARPSMGKTAVALDLFQNMPVQSLFISIEMTNARLYNRMVLGENVIRSSSLKYTSMNQNEFDLYYHIKDNFANKPLYFDEKTFKLSDIKATIKRAVRRYGIRIVFIDYLQLIKHQSKHNKEGEVSEISGTLKAIAKSEDIPIICLSQLSRDNQKENRKPKLSDLRGSGSLEQDADMIFFIHRDDYVDNKQNDISIPDDDSNITQLIVAKNRDGELRNIELNRNETFSKYWEVGTTPKTSFKNIEKKPIDPLFDNPF